MMQALFPYGHYNPVMKPVKLYEQYSEDLHESRRAQLGKALTDTQRKKREVGQKLSEVRSQYNREKNPQKKKLKALKAQELQLKIQLLAVKEKQLSLKKSMAKD